MTDATQDHTPQHLEALARATAIRKRRAVIAAAVQAGDTSLESIVMLDLPADDVDAIKNAALFDVLRWGHRIGRRGAHRILDKAQILNAEKRLGTMTGRQRAQVVAVLRGVAPWTTETTTEAEAS